MTDLPDMNGLALAVATADAALERAEARFNDANEKLASAASGLQRAIAGQMAATFAYRAAKEGLAK